MTTAIAPKTSAKAKQLTWTEEEDGTLRCGDFEIAREGRQHVLWCRDYFLCEGTLAVCRECAAACHIPLERWQAEIERRRDERLDEIEYEAAERMIEEEGAVIARLSKEFAPKRRRKRQNVR